MVGREYVKGRFGNFASEPTGERATTVRGIRGEGERVEGGYWLMRARKAELIVRGLVPRGGVGWRRVEVGIACESPERRYANDTAFLNFS